MLKISSLKVNIDKSEILKGVNLDIHRGETHALMGQNGSGKSTLAQTIMGNPSFMDFSGEIIFEGKNISHISPDERSKMGIFLSFQYPSEVSGVGVMNFLRMIYNQSHETHLSPVKFREFLAERTKILNIKPGLTSRFLNEGFSGGEKKKMEMLQMLVLEPKFIILDEVDSGLDVDALSYVAKAVNYLKGKNNSAVLLITHYARILKHIKPDFVHIMQNGLITKTGDSTLAEVIEQKGYSGGLKQ